MRRLALFLALTLLCGSAPASDDAKLFLSPGPAKEYADKMMQFGQLVGDWDIEYHAYLPDGTKVNTRCEWHWRWGLNGTAVVDSFICPARGVELKPDAPKREWGMTVRYYDPKIDAWHIAFVGPAYNHLDVLTARKVNDDMVLEGKSADDSLNRWMFTEITPRSFHWRGYKSTDQGKSWSLLEEMFVRRTP